MGNLGKFNKFTPQAEEAKVPRKVDTKSDIEKTEISKASPPEREIQQKKEKEEKKPYQRENVKKTVRKTKEQGLEKLPYLKIVLCGPPHSGKSCLREGLKEAVLDFVDKHNMNREIFYPYVITATPDGEGAWFQETVKFSPQVASQLKESYKSKFTPAFVNRVADAVKNCKLPLTFIDVGGLASKENAAITKAATHAIILAGDEKNIPEWHDFCERNQLKIIAEIISDYKGKMDKALTLGPDGIWRGSIHYLERGEEVSRRPTIQQLAGIIVKMAVQAHKKEDINRKENEEKWKYYHISLQEGNVLRIGFGEKAKNDVIVKEITNHLKEMIESGELPGGPLLKINGPASLPASMTISSKVTGLYKNVAVYDPKLDKYVVTFADGVTYKEGDLIN